MGNHSSQCLLAPGEREMKSKSSIVNSQYIFYNDKNNENRGEINDKQFF